MRKSTITFLLMCFLSMSIKAIDIQSLVNSLPEYGGTINLPASTIEIETPIVINKDNTRLIGTNTIIRLKNHANCPVIIIGGPRNNPTNIVRNIMINNIIIDGNRTNQDRETWKLSGEGANIRNNGIVIQSAENVTVDSVVCKNCRSGGIVTTLNDRWLTIKNVECYNNQFDGIGAYLTENSIFENIYLHDNVCAGMSVDLYFNHNTVVNAVLENNDIGVFMRSSHSNKFTNVLLTSNKKYAVFLADSLLSATSNCTSNTFNSLILSNNVVKINNSSCTNNTFTLR